LHLVGLSLRPTFHDARSQEPKIMYRNLLKDGLNNLGYATSNNNLIHTKTIMKPVNVGDRVLIKDFLVFSDRAS